MEGYKSETVELGDEASLSPSQAEAFVGKTIANVYNSYCVLILEFTDGTSLRAAGTGYEDATIEVNPVCRVTPTA